MKLRFNYMFLKYWFEVNPQYKKSDLMQILETKDYSSINRYIEGSLPPSPEQIIRICNAFSIPLSCWFFDLDTDNKPKDMSYTIPVGGFTDGPVTGGRKHLEPSVNNPNVSNIPEMSIKTAHTPIFNSISEEDEKVVPAINTEEVHVSVEKTHNNNDVPVHIHEQEISQLKDLHEQDLSAELKRHKKALKEAADRHAAERLTLIDIIKKQQDELASVKEANERHDQERIELVAIIKQLTSNQ